jgi:hypothetical protein
VLAFSFLVKVNHPNAVVTDFVVLTTSGGLTGVDKISFKYSPYTMAFEICNKSTKVLGGNFDQLYEPTYIAELVAAEKYMFLFINKKKPSKEIEGDREKNGEKKKTPSHILF